MVLADERVCGTLQVRRLQRVVLGCFGVKSARLVTPDELRVDQGVIGTSRNLLLTIQKQPYDRI